MYRCGTDLAWYKNGGELVLPTGNDLVALGYNGVKLARSTTATAGPAVIDEQGTETPVQGINLDGLVAFRARQDGFWAAKLGESQLAFELWQIGFDGQATLVGTYAQPPADADGLTRLVLDGEGNAYSIGRSTGNASYDLVVKLPLEPGTSEIVYTEEGLPENDWSVFPPQVYVRIHISGLISGR